MVQDIGYDKLTEEVEVHNLLCQKIGKMFSRLKSSLQEFLVPVPIVIRTVLFCILKILLLYEVFPQNIKP